MTDPIEQARHSALMGASNAVVLGILAGDAYEPMIAYEQAILRYHPDVVRLVEAARVGLDYLIHKPEQTETEALIASMTIAGLIPFEEVHG